MSSHPQELLPKTKSHKSIHRYQAMLTRDRNCFSHYFELFTKRRCSLKVSLYVDEEDTKKWNHF